MEAGGVAGPAASEKRKLEWYFCTAIFGILRVADADGGTSVEFVWSMDWTLERRERAFLAMGEESSVGWGGGGLWNAQQSGVSEQDHPWHLEIFGGQPLMK
ncbi:hypothetical protein NLG97_g9239 [Lecanicillium saksenae]|uniref:Uncharacterized protein n=1 Tax=Lecanicillium saksenae TaxID=468837 RepID=A0ACC1QGL1_9HYPO|nr:hypothetical protein NLG97_g9239 [Lecanicillium saksenae]